MKFFVWYCKRFTDKDKKLCLLDLIGRGIGVLIIDFIAISILTLTITFQYYILAAKNYPTAWTAVAFIFLFQLIILGTQFYPQLCQFIEYLSEKAQEIRKNSQKLY